MLSLASVDHVNRSGAKPTLHYHCDPTYVADGAMLAREFGKMLEQAEEEEKNSAKVARTYYSSSHGLLDVDLRSAAWKASSMMDSQSAL